MNIRQLHRALGQAMAEGVDPNCEVVVQTDDWYVIVDEPLWPAANAAHGMDMWFTLTLGEHADSRFTPGSPMGE